MKQLRKVCGLIIIAVGLATSSCGKQEKKVQSKTENQSIQKTDSLSTEKEFIEVDMNVVGTVKKGDTFEIKKKEEDKIFRLQVRRVEETIPGITSISANIENKETGLATLLLRKGKLSGMMDIYKESLKYRVGYDSVAGAHYLQEMLREEMDRLEGGAPLVPDSGNP